MSTRTKGSRRTYPRERDSSTVAGLADGLVRIVPGDAGQPVAAAALAAATATTGSVIGEKGEDASVRATPDALVLFNPALNLRFEKVHQMWGDDVYAKIAAISPHQNVSKDLPPTIIFHGMADTTVSYNSAEAFVAKAKEAGAKQVELKGYQDKGHGFFNHGRNRNADYESTVKEMTKFLVDLGWVKAQRV